jgi:hypothetical protein
LRRRSFHSVGKEGNGKRNGETMSMYNSIRRVTNCISFCLLTLPPPSMHLFVDAVFHVYFIQAANRRPRSTSSPSQTFRRHRPHSIHGLHSTHSSVSRPTRSGHVSLSLSRLLRLLIALQNDSTPLLLIRDSHSRQY